MTNNPIHQPFSRRYRLTSDGRATEFIERAPSADGTLCLRPITVALRRLLSGTLAGSDLRGVFGLLRKSISFQGLRVIGRLSSADLTARSVLVGVSLVVACAGSSLVQAQSVSTSGDVSPIQAPNPSPSWSVPAVYMLAMPGLGR